MAIKNLVDEKFGSWVVIKFDGFGGSQPYWECRCICGKVKSVSGGSLLAGTSKSCGCQRRSRLTHGKTGTPEHKIWGSMHGRCTSKYHTSYDRYGARGVKVCKRWKSFENFLADMGERPTPEHQIERKDNTKDYAPDNCVWATAKEQARNRRSSKFIDYEGQRMTVAEAAERAGVHYVTFWKRLRKQGIV
jgi:hypothetical protein